LNGQGLTILSDPYDTDLARNLLAKRIIEAAM
jgi:hypothetical protein